MNLYRKYRPSSFAQVAGQRHITIPLIRQLERGMIAHAYLFSGPRGVGKTTVARLLAKGVNCENNKNGEACEKCTACEAIKRGSMDIIEIDAASHTSVENVREVIVEGARFHPSELKKKIFIIDEAHMLSKNAFNALLKTLEEPPPHVMFILATTEMRKIPDTVQSRCQIFDFHAVPIDVMVERLRVLAKEEGVKVDDDVLFEIARRGEGCMRDSEGVLAQVLSIGEQHITKDSAAPILPVRDTVRVFDLIRSVADGNIKTAFLSLSAMTEAGGNIADNVEFAVDLLREELLERCGAPISASLCSISSKEELRTILQPVANEKIKFCINAFSVAIHDEHLYHIPSLAYELAVFDLCHQMTTGASKPTGVGDNVSVIGGVVGIDAVEKQWPNFIKQVREKHASLPLALEGAKPNRVEGNSVVIGVTYAFYAEAVNAVKNSQFLSGLMSVLLGSEVSVKAEWVKTPEPLLDGIIDAFGGVLAD